MQQLINDPNYYLLTIMTDEACELKKKLKSYDNFHSVNTWVEQNSELRIGSLSICECEFELN